jgi:hypothetical protein
MHIVFDENNNNKNIYNKNKTIETILEILKDGYFYSMIVSL